MMVWAWEKGAKCYWAEAGSMELVVQAGQVVCLGKWLFWSCIY